MFYATCTGIFHLVFEQKQQLVIEAVPKGKTSKAKGHGAGRGEPKTNRYMGLQGTETADIKNVRRPPY